MSEHFELELTNRSTRIKIISGVSDNFAEEYRNTLTGNWDRESEDSTPDEEMSDAMKTILGYNFIGAPIDYKNPPIGYLEKYPSSKKHSSKNTEIDQTGKYQRYNYGKRMKERCANFKTLAFINFKIPNVQFVTLTFDSRIVSTANDLHTCHKEFDKFIKRVRHNFKDFLFLTVYNRQKNGNWHYHMLCNFDESVRNKQIQELWKCGMTHSTPLYKYYDFENKISYCIDNMMEASISDLQGEKGYRRSQYLQNKIRLRSWNENERESAYLYLQEILNDDKPIFPLSSKTIDSGNTIVSKLLSDDGSFSEVILNDAQVTYLIARKAFNKLFQTPLVAKMK